MAFPSVLDLTGAVGDLVGTLANPFGSPSAGEWNLTKGAYKNGDGKEVIFFFEQRSGEDRYQRTGLETISDGGGRRKVIYEYPYLDGQRLEDLGRKGEKFSFNVKFFGSNHQLLLKKFLDVVGNSRESGILTHPVRGQIPAAFIDWEMVYRYDEFNSVTIRANFAEDNTGKIRDQNLRAASPDSVLRNVLQALTDVQSFVGGAIFTVGAALLIPAAIKNAMNQRLQSILGQTSRLLGQLAATFSTNAQLQKLAAQAQALANGVAGLSAGTVTTTSSSGQSSTTQLPPVFQVGFSPTDQATINQQVQSFIGASQITTQQAVFNSNQIRQAISDAIKEVEFYFGNAGYDIILKYRTFAVQLQEAVESCISSASSAVTVYTVPFDMSLRRVAFENGLSYDRQNDIEQLNPYLGSVNLIPKDTKLVVPAA